MATHGSNIISQIKLPNDTTYEIHDAKAFHSVDELGLPTYLTFKGVKDKYSDLSSLIGQVGDVWHVKEDDCEYVYVDSAIKWEALGNVHDAASSSHIGADNR